MNAALPTPPLSEAEKIVQLKKELHWAHLKIQVLEERLRKQRIQKYGPASEKLNEAQLELLELEPGVSRAEVQAESERPPLPAPPASGPAGTARLAAAHRERDRLHAGTVPLPGLRPAHGGDRARVE